MLKVVVERDYVLLINIKMIIARIYIKEKKFSPGNILVIGFPQTMSGFRIKTDG